MSKYWDLKNTLLKRDADMIRNDFREHRATVFPGPIPRIRWAKPGDVFCSIDILFFSRYLIFVGDMGDAVFDLTWKPTVTEHPPNDMAYFLGKLSACDTDDTWNEDLAETYVRGEDLKSADRQVLLRAARCDKETFLTAVRDRWDHGLDGETCSAFYSCGNLTHIRKQSYFIAWHMAHAQIVAEPVEEEQVAA